MINRKRISAIRRISILFCLMEVIAITAIILLFLRFADAQNEDARLEYLQRAEQSIGNTDHQLRSAYDIAENLFNDTRVAQIAYGMYKDEYEKSQLVLGLLNTLKGVCSLNQYIDDISITFPGKNISLSTTGGYDSAVILSENTGDLKLNHYMSISGQRLKIHFSYPYYLDPAEETADYEICLSLSDSLLTNYLDIYDGTQTTATFLVELPEGYVNIFGDTADQGEWQAGVWESMTNESPSVKSIQTEHSENGTRYSITYYASQNYPLVYASWQTDTVMRRRIGALLMAIFGIILLETTVILVVTGQTQKTIARPIRKLAEAFDKVSEGQLQTRIFHESNDEFHDIYGRFNHMTERMGVLIENINEQSRLLQNAELLQLQAQIDPHFLYNSFYAIKYMARNEDYEQIESMVTALADYYRFINKETRQTIPLRDEVAHMDSYIFIQQMRFGDRIAIEETPLPEEVSSYLVPKLILQPIVENTYKYGIRNRLSDGIIRIDYRTEGSILFIYIEDNGEDMTQERLMDMRTKILSQNDEDICHALTNTRRRLELAYGEADVLSLSIGELGGLKVTIRLDLTKEVLNL